MHNTPRFGHKKQISKIASSNKEEQVDYVMGAIFFPALLLVIFVYWVIIIYTLKCLGTKRTGFLSGSNLVKESRYKGCSHLSRPRIVRTFFLIIGSLTLVLCFSLAHASYKHFQNILPFTHNILKIRDIIDESLIIAASLVNIGENIRSMRDDFVRYINGLCPGAGSGDILKSIQADNLLNQLDLLNEYIIIGTQQLNSVLPIISKIINDIIIGIDRWIGWGWLPLFPVIPYMLVIALFIIATISVWLNVSNKRFQSFTSWIAIPIFTALTTLCWFVASILGFAAILNADLCHGGNETKLGPEMTLQSTINETQLSKDEFLYDILMYYTMGCTYDDPFIFVEDYERDLQSVVRELKRYELMISIQGHEKINDMCKQDVSHVLNMLGPFHDNLDELLFNLRKTLSLIACPRINKLYVSIVHEGLCTDSINALTSIYVHMTVIAMCGMIIITLRASWLKTLRNDYDLCYSNDDEKSTTIALKSIPSFFDEIEHDEDFSLGYSHQSNTLSKEEYSHITPKRKSEILYAQDDDLFSDAESAHSASKSTNKQKGLYEEISYESEEQRDDTQSDTSTDQSERSHDKK